LVLSLTLINGVHGLTSPAPQVIASVSQLDAYTNSQFSVEFEITNFGGPSSTDSYLSLTMSDGLEVTSWYTTPYITDMIAKIYPVGDLIWNEYNLLVTTENLLLDVYSHPFNSAESLTVTVFFQTCTYESNNEWIKYRVAMLPEGINYPTLTPTARDPTVSNIEDQQGYPVYQIKVTVNDEVPEPPPADSTNIWTYPMIMSESYSGKIPVDTFYSSTPPTGRPFPSLSMPANEEIEILLEGSLQDSNKETIGNKQIELLIDNELITTFQTSNKTQLNLGNTIILNLSPGFHFAELRFEGDETYSASTHSFDILAYTSSGFSVTKDAYAFKNWHYSFEEHLEMIYKLRQEGVIELVTQLYLTMVYPLIALGGHCFGMAGSSAVFYLNPELKPESVDTYALQKNDVWWEIVWYHKCQTEFMNDKESFSTALSNFKSMIDSRIPVILGIHYEEQGEHVGHALTLIGYYEDPAGTYLVFYDNNLSNSTVTYKLIEGNLVYGTHSKAPRITEGVFVTPSDLPPAYYYIPERINLILENYVGLQIHSPVNVNITSENGEQLLVEDDQVIRNDFEDSYVYIGESKIFLLPSVGDYSLEAIGTSSGEVSLDSLYLKENVMTANQFQNITVNYGSKLSMESLKSETLHLDSDGDDNFDEEITRVIDPYQQPSSAPETSTETEEPEQPTEVEEPETQTDPTQTIGEPALINTEIAIIATVIVVCIIAIVSFWALKKRR